MSLSCSHCSAYLEFWSCFDARQRDIHSRKRNHTNRLNSVYLLGFKKQKENNNIPKHTVNMNSRSTSAFSASVWKLCNKQIINEQFLLRLKISIVLQEWFVCSFLFIFLHYIWCYCWCCRHWCFLQRVDLLKAIVHLLYIPNKLFHLGS